MCGPLALSLPLTNNNSLGRIRWRLPANGGRVVTYSVFGLLFGAIGETVSLFGVATMAVGGIGCADPVIWMVLPNGSRAATA